MYTFYLIIIKKFYMVLDGNWQGGVFLIEHIMCIYKGMYNYN